MNTHGQLLWRYLSAYRRLRHAEPAKRPGRDMSDTTSVVRVSVLFLTKQPCVIVRLAMNNSRRTVLSLPLLLAMGGGARAESWPTHAIKFTVPWPAGGVADTSAHHRGEAVRAARPEADRRESSRRRGQYRHGGGGRRAADGYTLVLTPTGKLTFASPAREAALIWPVSF
jgi:hypothetical protein